MKTHKMIEMTLFILKNHSDFETNILQNALQLLYILLIINHDDMEIFLIKSDILEIMHIMIRFYTL
jgi:hypothetical protein